MVTRRDSLGTTLVELAVVVVFMLTLLTLVALFFDRGKRYTADNIAYSTLHEKANLAMRRIKESLYRGSKSHLATDDSETGYVYFLSSRSNDPAAPIVDLTGPSGQVVWQMWNCLYHDLATQEVWLAEVPLTPPTASVAAKPLPHLEISDFRTTTQRRVIGKQINRLEFSKFGNSVQIILEATGSSPVNQRRPEDKIIKIQLISQVSLTN